MAPEDCKVGTEVLYEPSSFHRFRGTVAAEPWQLGEGTWVTRLEGMEDGTLPTRASRRGRFTRRRYRELNLTNNFFREELPDHVPTMFRVPQQ